ncbi:MAG: ABC transporter ATP-binding protein [Candidatus Brockarchaeota archaeon]|nr:ABC transporter ATP-binding protein [Candidatus Brockarchaeota archaeon]
MPSVRLVGVSKRFGRILAVNRVSLEVQDGQYACVLGPTGSGKTTLLKLIAGLVQADEGEILFDGNSVNDLPPERRSAVYVPQRYALFPHLTVKENVAFGALAKGAPRAEAEAVASRMLELVRLGKRGDALPHELSGGMQQRVALARGLASGAKLLLLDEPLGALDARLRIELRQQLRKLVKELNLTAIHVTHDQEEAMTIGDAIVVLREGRVEQAGTPFHVYQRPESIFSANFVGDTNFLEGVVAERGARESTLELRRSLRVKVSDVSYLPGERVVVAVRQQRTHVSSGGEGGMNALDGRVRAVRFLGNFVKCEVRLENGDEVSCKLMLAAGAPKVGESVKVCFRPEDCVLFPYPHAGLSRELEAV